MAQRNAKHYLELVCSIIFSLAILTFVWPKLACIFGALNLVLRTGFFITYSEAPKKRVIWAKLLMVNTIVTMGAAAYASIYWHG